MGTNKVATAVVFDVSLSTAGATLDGQSYFDRAKSCLERIILRKLFSGENDELGLILIGSEKTNNRLFKDGDDYGNIEEWSGLQIPTWDLLNRAVSIEQSSVESGDWVEGFVVGLNYMKEETRGKRFKDRQLVIFSTLESSESYSLDKLDPLVNIVAAESVNVVFIGVDIKDDDDNVMFKFISKLETGMWLDFNDAEEEFKFYEKKRKMKRLTRVSLDIGTAVKIPMKWMKLTLEETRISWRRQLSSIPQTSREELLKQNPKAAEKIVGQNTTPEKIVGQSTISEKITEYKNETDIVDYVKFGGTKVFLSYADQEAMKRKTGPPIFTYLGSVKKSRISRAMLCGQEIYVAVPDGTARSHALVSALISALQTENKLGLARRIVSNNGKIYLGLLLPVSDELGKALYFVKVPFADNIRSVAYRPLPTEKDEKLNELIDGFINSKMLDDDPKNVLFKDPSYQERCHILYSRAKHGKKDVELPEHIKQLFDPYPNLKEAAKPFAADLNAKYYIKYTESGSKRLEESKYVPNREEKKITEDEVKEIMEINKIVENIADLSDDEMFDFKIDTQTQNYTQILNEKF